MVSRRRARRTEEPPMSAASIEIRATEYELLPRLRAARALIAPCVVSFPSDGSTTVRRLFSATVRCFRAVILGGIDDRHQAAAAINKLTEREREILINVAHGLSNTEIADNMHISESTAKTPSNGS